MALIRCGAGATGTDMSNWTYTDISSSLTSGANQNFTVSSSADLSEYDAIVIRATYASGKNGNFTASGCTIVYQLNASAQLDTTTTAEKLVMINDISASGFTLTNATSVSGTGGSKVVGFGIKFN